VNNPAAIYNSIITNEKLEDFDLMELLMERFRNIDLDKNEWMDVIKCTRQNRPKVIRMGNVPTTNWCMKG
jgi:hypothetical protein